MKPSISTATLLGFITATIFAINLAGPTIAADTTTANFRVDNGIFKLPRTKPHSRSVTIFLDGIVYDFMIDSKQITIFDEIQNVFTLIDVDRGVQTVIPMQFVDKAIERLATRAASKSDPKTKFLYNPKFEPTQKDTSTGELLFKSVWLTYRVEAKQGDVKATRQYRRFADAYAKLNTVLWPGSKPPFARMLINKTLDEGTMLPKSVLRTEGKVTDVNALRFQSEHRYEMKLDQSDIKRVDDARKSLETLKIVALDEYQKP